MLKTHRCKGKNKLYFFISYPKLTTIKSLRYPLLKNRFCVTPLTCRAITFLCSYYRQVFTAESFIYHTMAPFAATQSAPRHVRLVSSRQAGRTCIKEAPDNYSLIPVIFAVVEFLTCVFSEVTLFFLSIMICLGSTGLAATGGERHLPWVKRSSRETALIA